MVAMSGPVVLDNSLDPKIDLRVTNCRIWNGETITPRRLDLLVDAGRVLELVDPATVVAASETLDLDGAVVTPGLIDSHVHLLLAGESSVHLDLSQVDGREAFEAAIEAADAALPPERWLIATGWNDTLWERDDLPDRAWLRAAGSRPVVCWRCDWHCALVNDAVLRRLDLDGPLPAGGRLGRMHDGTPSGLLIEAAAWELVNPLIPSLPEQVRGEAVEQAAAAMAACGITATRSMEYRGDIESHFVPRADTLPIRLSLVQLDRSLPLDTGWHHDLPNTDRFALTGCKAFFDGTLGSRTAKLTSPYSDASETSGLWLEAANENQDERWCREVVAAGLAPVIHAIGDAAVSRALRVIGDVPDALRPTIEHAEVIAPEIFPTLEGVRLSVQPTHRATDAAMAHARLGDRAGWLLPMREMCEAGGRLCFGTDWPIVPVDPVATLRAAITGEDAQGNPFFPEQRLSPHEAMLAATVNAAEACGFDAGLRAGLPADFVVWSSDPFEDIFTATVQATFVDGTLVAGELRQGACHG
jgi:predicted amidohydrolase YtcJ